MAEAPYDEEAMDRLLHTQSTAPLVPRDRDDLSYLSKSGRRVAEMLGFRSRTPVPGPSPKRVTTGVFTQEDIATAIRDSSGRQIPSRRTAFFAEHRPNVQLRKLSRQQLDEDARRYRAKTEGRHLRRTLEAQAEGTLSPRTTQLMIEAGAPQFREPKRTKIRETERDRQERHRSG